MLRFILRRLLVAIPTLFVIITVSFFLMRAAPGGPYTIQRKLPPEIEANMKAAYGLDQPLVVQYGHYLADVAKGDFGPSMRYAGRSVVEIIGQAVPTSLIIGLPSLVLSILLGIFLGVIAALHQNRTLDYTASLIAVLGICVPTLVMGPMLVYVFASRLGFLPVAGIQSGWKSYVLPIIVLTIPGLAGITRLTRSAKIEVMRSNYVRTARAKGLSEWRIIMRHALKPALLPLISFFGPALAGVITGSLVIEKMFRIPGVGRTFYTASIQRDYPLAMAIVILYATLIIVFNLIADLIYAAMDPRVRLT